MGKINVLDKHTAELIAAGEVVERPSSVIKELVENSIDSGATAVTVEIRDGGVTMMRVSDNGSGIMRDDVRNAFKRHATSKVKLKEDLDAIGTLGFRGEALASICAVAKVDLLTKAGEEEIGTHYKIEGGDEILLEDAGCPDGTTFIIRNLFYNVPARMKFLKKNTSEANAVAAVIDKIALSHSEVAFTFIRDNKQVLVTSGDGSEKNCIYSVLGREFSNNSVPVSYELNGITVKGYVTKPQASRASRAMQNFFINGRFVKSRTAMAALEEACKGMVMVGKYPGCVLHIGIPYALVDVNVHPAKIEVRFVNERPVFEAVYHGVRSALLDGDTVKQFRLDPQKAVNDLIDKSVVKKPFTMSQYEVKKIENTPVVRPSSAQEKKAIGIYSSLLDDTSLKENKSGNFVFNDPIAELPRVSESAISAHNTGRFDPASDERRPYRGIDISVDEESVLGIVPANDVRAKSQTENAAGSSEYMETDNSPAENTSLPQEDIPTNDPEQTADHSEDSIDEIPVNTTIAGNSENAGIPQPASSEEETQQAEATENEIKPLTDVGGDVVRFVGEAFKTYIIIEKNNDIILIDKHALHERIIYEKLKREQGKKYAQYLLEPVAVTLSKQQYNGVMEKKELMYESGFEIDDFGGSTILVRSAPSFIGAYDVAATIEEMADHILDNKNNIESEYTDWLYHNIACRSAIKGGDKSTPQELIDLYIKMGESPDYRYCPHGRPTSIVMTRYQIEKQFGRLG